ncbi:MAG: O-acetylhomoserine aminocarboxypropyltransferase/cysteine synthase family protein [Chloroherpetonaceae bacterium]|nr:O-acetylhomoserine aminocarboxypropyltransferase/cysteine synthase [Chthonomonadaceae bacterium]MDW8207612.1 O-acetylhomoserine aminocarboxypropyltransferase/cysteine synthase family protein [Chloroherpetonaceae bacterium]
MNHGPKTRQWRLETLALHGDPALGPVAGATALPIHQTAAYNFASVEEAAARFVLDDSGPIYSRIGNPTVSAFEQRMAALEGGIGAVATASGQAAAFFAVCNLTRAGENIVASTSLYGGIYSLFRNVLAGFGIEVRFVPVDDLAAWRAAVDDRTTCLYAEMIGNPLLDTPDLEALADLAHAHRIPLIVDQTVPTAVLCQPFLHGADVVVYSATKYVCGHGTTIGGVVVDSGRFDWASGRFPQFTEPDPLYPGVVLAEKFGRMAYLIRMRGHLLRDVGACMAPMTAWALLQGVETLPVRMAKHCDNAEALVDWLAAHPRVERVVYPGRRDHPTRHNAQRYLRRGSGMVGMYVRGGYRAAQQVVERVQLFSHAANLGDCKSLIIHPASTTHAPVAPEVRRTIGIEDHFVRLSVGLEHVEDLKADLDAALN